MTFTKDPETFEENAKDFPVLNQVVNVSNCYYYLSLLERFADATKNMDQVTLKHYLVRSESRYFRWMMYSPYFKLGDNFYPPPLDVAFFWHAHMLSPLRYQEDQNKLFGGTMYDVPIPLKEIYESRNEPTSATLENWHKMMGRNEPYDLKKSDLLDGCTKILCIVCSNSVSIAWAKFTLWRTDERVAIRCHCCDSEFTTKHYGKANLIQDTSLEFQISQVAYHHYGLCVDAKGNFNPKKKSDVTKLLVSNFEISKLPFDSGLDALEQMIFNHLEKHQQFTTSYKEKNDQEQRVKELMTAIESTYFCTPYRSSIDLIVAVARQFDFAFKATTKMDWQLLDIAQGIKSYHDFLLMIKRSPGVVPVPSLAIDLAWHTHMLHPQTYKKFSNNHLKYILNHDDCIVPADLDMYIEKFDLLKKYYYMEHQDNIKKKKSLFRLSFGESRAEEGGLGSDYWDGNSELPVIREDSSTKNPIESYSYHDPRKGFSLLNLFNSEDYQTRLLNALKGPMNLGFIGTTACIFGVKTSLRPRLEIPGYSHVDESYSTVIDSKGKIPNIPSHVHEILPDYLKERYRDPQTYNNTIEARSDYEELEDIPPPAYGSYEEVVVPGHPALAPPPIRNFNWYFLLTTFLALKIYNNETKPFMRTTITDAVPIFAFELTKSYVDLELTVFGVIEKSQLPTF